MDIFVRGGAVNGKQTKKTASLCLYPPLHHLPSSSPIISLFFFKTSTTRRFAAVSVLFRQQRVNDASANPRHASGANPAQAFLVHALSEDLAEELCAWGG